MIIKAGQVYACTDYAEELRRSAIMKLEHKIYGPYDDENKPPLPHERGAYEKELKQIQNGEIKFNADIKVLGVSSDRLTVHTSGGDIGAKDFIGDVTAGNIVLQKDLKERLSLFDRIASACSRIDKSKGSILPQQTNKMTRGSQDMSL